MGRDKTKTLTIADAFQEGVASQQRGDWAQAERIYREIVKVKPDFAEAHNNLGAALKALDRPEEAVDAYRQAVAIRSDYAEAHNNLGNGLRSLEHAEEAAKSYQDAVAAAPDFVDAHLNLAATLMTLDRQEAAIPCYRHALTIRPDDQDAHINLGVALEKLGRPEEAIESYRRVLAIAPAHAGAHNNLGNALMALNRNAEAIESYRTALAVVPDHPFAHINLGVALQGLNRHQEAIDRFRKAQQIKPDFFEAHWNESLALLCLGDFKTGWPKYENRWLRKDAAERPSFDRPLWLGGDDVDLDGKTILLHAEQGFGDTIQFVRFAPIVAGLGATVVLGVQPSLVALVVNSLASLAPDHADRVSVASKSDTIPPFDLACPLLSLPLALGTRVSTIPAAVPYLSPPPDRVAAWQARLAEGRRRVGIAWSGKTAHVNDRNRTIPFAALAPLLSRADIDFYVLQNQLRDGDREAVEKFPSLTYLGDELNDFADTAALTAAMDLVISVDTSIAHLAGALARPVWVLLPFSPDWRWMLDRDDSPWYPTARLFRQPAIGDWDAVIARATAAL